MTLSECLGDWPGMLFWTTMTWCISSQRLGKEVLQICSQMLREKGKKVSRATRGCCPPCDRRGSLFQRDACPDKYSMIYNLQYRVERGPAGHLKELQSSGHDLLRRHKGSHVARDPSQHHIEHAQVVCQATLLRQSHIHLHGRPSEFRQKPGPGAAAETDCRCSQTGVHSPHRSQWVSTCALSRSKLSKGNLVEFHVVKRCSAALHVCFSREFALPNALVCCKQPDNILSPVMSSS